jgi:argininosuccinate lyase
VDTLLSTLAVVAPMMATLRIKTDRISRAAETDYMLATDIADYLVKKGVPFRKAHSIVGNLVRYAIETGKALHDIDLIEYRRFCPDFENDVKSITLESALAARNATGGTAPDEVEKALAAARRSLNAKED